MNELEELLVKLSGDASSYIKMLNDAKSKTDTSSSAISDSVDKSTVKAQSSINKLGEVTTKYAGEIAKLAEDIKAMGNAQETAEKKTKSLGEKFTSAGKDLKAFGKELNELGEALSKVTGDFSIKDALKEFREAEYNTKLLTAALEANGREVETLKSEYEDFAKEIEDSTTFSQSETIALLRQAEALDVTGDAAKRAVKNALALAESQGKQATEIIKATAALERGSTKAISEHLPQLRKFTSESEKAVEAQRLLANAYKQVEAATETAVGVNKRLTNSYNNFKETVGETISNVMEPFVSIIGKLVDAFNDLPGWIKITIGVILALTSGIAIGAVSIGTLIVAMSALFTSLNAIITVSTLATAGLLLLKGALIAGAAYGFYQLTIAITGASKAQEEFNKGMEESVKLNQKVTDRFTENTKNIVSSIDRIYDPAKKKLAIEEQLQRAQKELEGYRNQVSLSKKDVDENNSRWARFTGNKVLELAQANLKDANSKLELSKTRVDQLNNALNKFKQPEIDQKLIDDVEKFTNELKTQSATFGKTSDEVQLYKFKLQGATEQMLEMARAQAEINKDMKDFAALAGKIDSFFSGLREEIKFEGLSKSEIEIRKLKASLDELESKFKALKKANRSAPELSNLGEDIIIANGMLRAAEDLIKQKEALDKRVKFKALGTDITKNFRTPLQVFKDSVKELNDVFDNGSITQSVYDKALDDTKNKYLETTKAANQAKQAIEKFNAIPFNSLDAKARVDEFKDTLKQQMDEIKRVTKEKQKLNDAFDRPATREFDNRQAEPLNKLNDLAKQTSVFQARLDITNMDDIKNALPTQTKVNVVEGMNTISSNDANIRAVSTIDIGNKENTKEIVTVLKSMDTKLGTLSSKPISILGVASVQTNT